MEQSWHKLAIKYILIYLYLSFFSQASFAIPAIEGIHSYHSNMHLSTEHTKRLAADIHRYHNNEENIWEELRHEFSLSHYEDNPRVQEQIDWFMSHQDFLLRSATRAAPYLYFILQQVRKRQLPAEIVLLPMMESAYNPFAYSTVGAAGIWQMMPKTANGFGIKQDWWYDGRRDIVASTRAALDYLSYLGNFFDRNWLLAIGAYDTGEGNILSAIRKNIHAGKNTDFWSLPVAQETRVYVPRLLALATIISKPSKYRINWPHVRNAPYLAEVDIGKQIHLKHAALLAGISIKKLMQLNPGFSRPKTAPGGPFKLVLPIERVKQFTENLSKFSFQKSIQVALYRVKAGDTIFSLARKFKVSPKELRKLNLVINNNLKPGKYLKIPSNGTPNFNKSSNYISIADRIMLAKEKQAVYKQNNLTKKAILTKLGKKYKLQPGDTLYMVRKGDDLKKIAKRFNSSTNIIVAINQLDSGKKIRPGNKLIIPTHLSKLSFTKKYKLKNGDTIYMVRRGDNLEKIAAKFKTSSNSIKLINLLNSPRVQEGDRLIIPTHTG